MDVFNIRVRNTQDRQAGTLSLESCSLGQLEANGNDRNCNACCHNPRNNRSDLALLLRERVVPIVHMRSVERIKFLLIESE